MNKLGGVEVGGAGVDEVLREHDRLVFDGDFFGNFLEGARAVTRDNLVDHLEVGLLLALVGVELVFGVVEPVEDGLELFVGGIGKEKADAGNLFFHGAAGKAVGGHAQVIEGGKAALFCGIYEKCGLGVDFEVFQVFERTILHAIEDGFGLGVAGFGQHAGKLDGLLDKKQRIGLAFGGLGGFGGDNVQFHVHKDSNVLFCEKKKML